jgi:hypothetical protein
LVLIKLEALDHKVLQVQQALLEQLVRLALQELQVQLVQRAQPVRLVLHLQLLVQLVHVV